MTVRHSLRDGIFSAETVEELRFKVQEALLRLKVQAEVEIDGDAVVVSYPDTSDIEADEDERVVVGFCQSGRFGKARGAVKDLIARRPWDSNARRLEAQILMMKGEVDEALLSCFDALCLSPRNEYALVLMGNLLARDRNRFIEARKYYQLALGVNPDSALTLTNLAALRLETKDSDLDETERLLKRSLELDPRQLPAYHVLVHVRLLKGDSLGAFAAAQDGLRLGMARAENREPIRDLLLKTVMQIAPTIAGKGISPRVVAWMREIGDRHGVPIRLEDRDELDVPLRLELAQNHQRDMHVVAYNPEKAGNGLNHLLCMTLEKMEMAHEAKGVGRAKRMVSNEGHFRKFQSWTQPYLTDRFKALAGGREEELVRFLHHGLIEQLMNCVQDALAERRIFARMPELRPAQFLGVVELARGIVQSAQTGNSGSMPKNIVRATRTMGLFTLYAYHDIVGIDMRGDVGAPAEEVKLAADFFAAFKKLEEGYAPGDEWGLTASMAAALRLDPYFAVIPDDDHADLVDTARRAKAKLAARETMGVDALNEAFRSDLKNNPAIGMSVMFFMVDAIKSLRAMPETEVRKIAFQIATMGISGIQPGQKSGYRIPALPGKDMSGCQALAWYYASWRMAFPEKMASLEQSMPFADTYLWALQMLAAQGDE